MGGSLDNIMPGLEFFKHLKDIGNFNPVDCYPANIASGETPIAIVWDYLNLALPQAVPEHQVRVSIPTDGTYGGFYCQAISKSGTAPEGGQALAGVHLLRPGPARVPRRLRPPGAVHGHGGKPARSRLLLPSSCHRRAEYAGVRFPTLAQIDKASAIVVENWDSMVGGVLAADGRP